MKKFKKIHLVIYIPLILMLLFTGYVMKFYKAMPLAIQMSSSDENVTYKSSPFIEFNPVEKQTDTGLIIYPGGKVDPKAYIPMAKEIAAKGYKVIIVPMPFKLAVLSPNKADKVVSNYPEIKNWYISGHSLGGVMAAKYTHDRPNNIKGLILLASYPTSSSDLSSSKAKVTSIIATKDGFVKKEKLDESKSLLPPNTVWVEINGGNHSQFGYYGFQSGDNQADISREEQQTLVIEAILKTMAERN